MAALNYDDYGDGSYRSAVASAMNWAGAVLSILLIAGLATWGWKLWVRDVTGVPVVRALEGPMRIAPEDPGGLASDYQGLTVNRIAEERVDVEPSDRVVLAPQPATLDEEEDLAMAELPPVVAPAPTPDAAPAAISLEDEATEGMSPVVEVADEDVAAFTADAVSEDFDAVFEEDGAQEETASVTDADGIATLTEPTPSATDLAVAAALADIGLAPEPQFAARPAVMRIAAPAHVPARTPRPVGRPARLQQVSLAPDSGADGTVDPVRIPVGTRLVQLGAFGSAEVAEAEWQAAEERFGEYMGGKGRVIQETQSGGRTFFRLRAVGFDDLDDARRFCAVLVAEGANCIPVVQE